MINCIIHSTNCPNAPTSASNERGILLLWPGTLGLAVEKPRSLNWLKLWFEKEKYKVEEFQTGTDDTHLCELSAALNRNTILVADITLRDPQVYFGISLAHSSSKSIFLIVDARMEGVTFPDIIRYQTSDEAGKASHGLEELEHLIKSKVAGVKNRPVSVPSTSLPKIDGITLQKLFSQSPGKRSGEDAAFLKSAWKQILDVCRDRLPDSEWAIAANWHTTAYYNVNTDLFTIVPTIEEIGQSQQFLINPLYRQTIEQAIYDITSMNNNWIVKIERVTDL